MAQAIGRNAVLAGYDETTFGQVPGAPAGEKLYMRSNAITGSIARVIDETLSGLRGLPQSIAAQRDVQGDVPVVIAPQSIARWLKHLLGKDATTYRPARKTTALITGVEVLRAQSTSNAGNGTLAWTFGTTLITWSENGDTPGAGVNISAGGDFTLASTNGRQLYIRVTASMLPGSNQNDTVNVSAATTYSHVFTPRGVMPEGLLLELNLGAEISAANRWIRFLGGRVAQGQFRFMPTGFPEATFSYRAANFNNDAGAALDASLDDFGHAGFSMIGATIEEGGVAYASATDVALNIDNDLDDSLYTIGGGGIRGALPPGFLRASGSLTALFQDAALLNKALAGTESSLKITLAKGTGDGSAGNEALIVRVPNLIYDARTPPIEGPRGVRLALNYNANRPLIGESLLEMELRSTRSTV